MSYRPLLIIRLQLKSHTSSRCVQNTNSTNTIRLSEVRPLLPCVKLRFLSHWQGQLLSFMWISFSYLLGSYYKIHISNFRLCWILMVQLRCRRPLLRIHNLLALWDNNKMMMKLDVCWGLFVMILINISPCQSTQPKFIAKCILKCKVWNCMQTVLHLEAEINFMQ